MTMSNAENSSLPCRLCLSDYNHCFVEIFDEPLSNDSGFTLLQKIHTCLPVKVERDGQLSSKVCKSCLEAVNKFYDFWLLVDSSQKKLGDLAVPVKKINLTNESCDKTEELDIERRDSEEPNLSAKFADSTSLELESTRKNDSKKPVCRDCGVHNNDNNFKPGLSIIIPCAVCQQTALPNDIDNVKEKKYECSVCDYSNASMSNFKIHMMKHNGEYSVRCQYCDKGFYSRRTCEEHKSSKHSFGTTTNHCSECNNSYHSRAYLRQHLKTHSQDFKKENYQCEQCGKTYLSWKGVKRHKMIAHQGQVYQCGICDKEVKSLESLKNHQKIHRGEKPFVCTTCCQPFRTKSGLKIHERTHTGVKPYICTICGNAFSQSSSLKIHIRYHKGDRPYQCSLCNKSYVTATLLNKHRKSHNGSIQSENKNKSIENLQ